MTPAWAWGAKHLHRVPRPHTTVPAQGAPAQFDSEHPSEHSSYRYG